MNKFFLKLILIISSTMACYAMEKNADQVLFKLNQGGMIEKVDKATYENREELIQNLAKILTKFDLKNVIVSITTAQKSASTRLVIQANDTNYMQRVIENRLILPKEFINNASLDEIKFVFAHECAHIKNGDTSLKLSKIQENYTCASNISIFSGVAGILSQTINKTKLANTFIGLYILGITFQAYFSRPLRAMEKQADLDAANALDSACGGVKYFQSQNIFSKIFTLLPWSTHPSNLGRIKYLEQWQKNKNSKEEL